MWQGRQRLWMELGVWLTICAVGYAMTFDFDDPIQGYRYGATGWPRAIILGLAMVALLQFAIGMRKAIALEGPEAAITLRERLRTLDPVAAAKILLAFGMPLIYLVALPRTGFYLTTPVFLAVYLVLLGERSWLKVLLVTAIIYAIMIVIFTSVFYVPLPVGNWPIFYDIGNWLLQVYRY